MIGTLKKAILSAFQDGAVTTQPIAAQRTANDADANLPGGRYLNFLVPQRVGDAGSFDQTKSIRAEDVILQRIATLLAQALPAFTPADLQIVAEACTWCSVQGGGRVFLQGDEPDSIYVVVSGMLGAYQVDPRGQERLLGRIGAGEMVGEMGFVTGEPRTATVRALRSSELLRISRNELRSLAFRYPTLLMEMCSTVVRRLRTVQETGRAPHHQKTFCIVPQDYGLDARGLARHIAEVYGAASNPLILSKHDGDGKTADWFFQREQSHGLVVYIAEPTSESWTRFCLRQADCIVLLAHGSTQPRPFSALGRDHSGLPPDIPTDLVLMWGNTIESSGTSRWLDLVKPRAHYHIRNAADAARAARLVTGRSFGLVLSGGGARGLAHVGVMRALREHGIQIDAIGGASIGAVIGAGLALEWDLQSMADHCLKGFLRRPRLSDLGIPRASLFPGGKVDRLFHEWFGDVAIEETPIRYFCVSTNLTSGRLSVHTTGRLATWVKASSAIPGVFPPVLDEGAVHVDGGVLDNMPIETMRQLGVGSVIAVNVGSEEELVARGRMPGLLEILWRVGTIGSDSKIGSDFRRCDILLVPKVQHIRLLDWRSHQQAVEAGYRAALEQLPDLTTRLSKASNGPIRSATALASG